MGLNEAADNEVQKVKPRDIGRFEKKTMRRKRGRITSLQCAQAARGHLSQHCGNLSEELPPEENVAMRAA